jgi:cation diffusion facilitator family transporter
MTKDYFNRGWMQGVPPSGSYPWGVTATPRYERSEHAARISLGVTLILVVLKVIVWLSTSSLAVASQALDSVLDVVALSLVFVGVRIANKPADESHHYGHGKAENLAAFTQTLLIGVVVVVVGVESIRRLIGNSPAIEAPWYAIALLLISMAVDAARVVMLLRAARAEGSDALKAGALNIASDIATAGVTVLSLFAVRLDIADADSAGALLVALFVAFAAYRLGKHSVEVLMDTAPSSKVAAIQQAVASAPGVRSARRVRVRETGSGLFADVTVSAGRTASLDRVHDIAENVEREIEKVAPGTDVIVHVEPETESSGLVERVQAAASRQPDVYEVHNILVHAFDDRGEQRLHVTLHAKVRPTTSIQAAHDVADQLERAIERELGDSVRVDAHIEPLEPTAFATDVTEHRGDVVIAVGELASSEIDILDCHEVIVTSTGGELSVVAHVSGRATLPLSQLHDASERIENGLHARFPELGAVLLHFEPR